MGESIYSREYRLIIERLRNVRLEAGLTQVQAAQKLRKPQSYVSKIERGERRLDVVELQQFLKVYRKGLCDFFDK
jgi:transcriptional regulator with XRE-family HTH domain